MKTTLSVLTLATVLGACSSNPTVSHTQAQTLPQPVANPVVIAQERQDRIAERQVEQAPVWMSKLPKSENAVYANGSAVSSDFSMADMKAVTIAYAKICTSAGGKVRSQTKIYRSDNDTASSESSEIAVRSICPDVDISGVETVEMKHISEGGRIRSYVLVALPIGDANTIARAKQAVKDKETSIKRSEDAFKEVDKLVEPQSRVEPESKVSEVKLLDVDNEEYKKKRDEALQKPGAVIGQVTVR